MGGLQRRRRRKKECLLGFRVLGAVSVSVWVREGKRWRETDAESGGPNIYICFIYENGDCTLGFNFNFFRAREVKQGRGRKSQISVSERERNLNFQ